MAAQDRYAVFDTDSAVTLAQRSLQADARFFPAHILLIELRQLRGETLQLRREYARFSTGDSVLSACLRAVVGAPFGYGVQAVPALEALERSHGPTSCTAFYLAQLSHQLLPRSRWTPTARERARRAPMHVPETRHAWYVHGVTLEGEGRTAEAERVMMEGATRVLHPLDRVVLLSRAAIMVENRGDSARGAALRRTIAAAITRSGATHLAWWVTGIEADVAPTPAVWEERSRRRVAAARAGNSWALEWPVVLALGTRLSDAGNPVAALPEFDRAVRIADSTGRTLLRVIAYRQRGRTLSKLGRLNEAERDLTTAVALDSVADEPYQLAEAFHNLAHVHESAGRLLEASRAANRFVELTRSLMHAQPRVISLRDAGLIRWKAGWHASANAAFAEMVGVIDEQDEHHYWAGEYFERRGELARALVYYRAGANSGADRSLSLGGLTRVHEALALSDSAERSAARHDSAMTNQLDVPLLPGVLARRGRVADAVRITEAWTRKQRAQGNRHGAAIAGIELAELLIRSDRPRDARSEAAQVEATARALNLTDELVGAMRLQGIAATALGDTSDGLRLLRAAAAHASAHPTPAAIVRTQLSMADALAAMGDDDSALLAYDRAATQVERITTRLVADVDRARVHAWHLAAFDGATRLLARGTRPSNIDRLVTWSQRRKAAAFAFQSADTNPRRQREPTVVRGAVQQRLRPGEALVDYIALEGAYVAVLLTPQAAKLIRLDVRPDSVRRWLDRVRRPMITTYAGQLDLARAQYDLAAAHALYRALVEPVLGAAGSVRRMIVSPDGLLHFVPFDALVSRLPAGAASYRQAGYLVDQVEVVLVPSSRLLPRADGPATVAGGGVLAVAYDAPGADLEVAAIARAWPGNRLTTLLDSEATEHALVRHAAGRAILHFATHAVADAFDPLASHLRLARDQSADGYLHATEIAAVRHSARLVVLSACETLTGPLYDGAGLMGLARTFLASGAESVVATAWPIGEATAALMEHFYRALASGIEPATALRVAKLRLRNDQSTAHPFYWASFVFMQRGG